MPTVLEAEVGLPFVASSQPAVLLAAAGSVVSASLSLELEGQVRESREVRHGAQRASHCVIQRGHPYEAHREDREGHGHHGDRCAVHVGSDEDQLDEHTEE